MVILVEKDKKWDNPPPVTARYSVSIIMLLRHAVITSREKPTIRKPLISNKEKGIK